MSIVLVDASPKAQNSTSGKLLHMLKIDLDNKENICEMKIKTAMLSETDKSILQEADKIVFSLPLYVDGIPGHLLSCLVQMEEEKLLKPACMVYGIVNCGFYEGIQAQTALWILENWCCKSNLSWGGGLGIGGGGAMDCMSIMNPTKGPLRSIGKALQILAADIEKNTWGKCQYVQIDFPRFIYKLGAQIGWRKNIKASGLSKSDLGRQL